MRLIDADALLKDFYDEVHPLYDRTVNEWKEHADLEDERSIYLHSMEQYTKVKFAYCWLKARVRNSPTVEPKNGIWTCEDYDKKIELPKDPTYDELERYSQEVYQQGRADATKEMDLTSVYAKGRTDAIEELKNKLYERARDKGIYASEYIAFIDCTFEQLKEQTE